MPVSKSLIRAVRQMDERLALALENSKAMRERHETPETMVPHFLPCDEHGYDLVYYGYDWEVRNLDHPRLFAVEVSCDQSGSWDTQNEWEVETPADLRKIQRYITQDLKRGLRTIYDYSRFVLMRTYGQDPCGEFLSPTPAGKMAAAFAHLTHERCPVPYRLKKWEVQKARERMHAASIARNPITPVLAGV